MHELPKTTTITKHTNKNNNLNQHESNKCMYTILQQVNLNKYALLPQRVTKCRFGHSELLTPTERAINQLHFHTSFKIVHNAKVKLWPL